MAINSRNYQTLQKAHPRAIAIQSSADGSDIFGVALTLEIWRTISLSNDRPYMYASIPSLITGIRFSAFTDPIKYKVENLIFCNVNLDSLNIYVFVKY